jgi:hypothetical protein
MRLSAAGERRRASSRNFNVLKLGVPGERPEFSRLPPLFALPSFFGISKTNISKTNYVIATTYELRLKNQSLTILARAVA